MRTYLRYALVVLGVAMLALIVRVSFNAWARHPLFFLSQPMATTSLATASAYQATGYVDQTGIILIDYSHGEPGVPFLQYATGSNGVATKELVFPWSNGCNPYAGDLPCVLPNPDALAPEIPTGEPVRVQGALKDQRILVYQVTPVY